MPDLAERATVPAIGRDIPTQEEYLRHLEAKRAQDDRSCDLCSAVTRQGETGRYPIVNGEPFGLINDHFALIENDFPYFAYDGRKVEAHHMLLPRIHVGNRAVLLDRLLRHAEVDALSEIQERTGDHYSAYLTRSSSSPSSSIQEHEHMHLFHLGPAVVAQVFSIANRRNDVTFSDRLLSDGAVIIGTSNR